MVAHRCRACLPSSRRRRPEILRTASRGCNRYASQPGMGMQQPQGGMLPLGGQNRFSALFPFSPGTNLMQAADQRMSNPNQAAKPRSPVPTMATADGVRQAMKQGSFGAQPLALKSAREALFYLTGKRADVPTSGNDAPGAQPAGGNSGQNARRPRGGFSQPSAGWGGCAWPCVAGKSALRPPDRGAGIARGADGLGGSIAGGMP
jgi:hypothetical protein